MCRRINRRAFVVSAAAAGGGLALGLEIPFGGPQVIRAQDGSPEVNAWVVIRPDDTVVIRVARAEMGQGSMTGLAQLVAEELECDWSKVSNDHPTPGQNLPANAPGATSPPSAAGQSASRRNTCAKAARPLARCSFRPRPTSGRCLRRRCNAANSTISHKASGRTTTYGKVAEAAAKIEPPKEVKLKDPKDWKIAGKPLKRLDTVDKTTGKQIYSMDVKLPGMLNAADQGKPGLRWQGEKLRRRQGRRHAGREKGGAERRCRRCRHCRHLVAGQDRARGAADRLGRRTERQGLQRHDRRHAQGRARRRGSVRRQPAGRRQGGDRRRRQEGRGGLRVSVPEPCCHGADERDSASTAATVRGVDQLAKR